MANPQVTDEMVEKALDAWLASPSEDTLASIRAALTAALADHVVVPREPTDAIKQAVIKTIDANFPGPGSDIEILYRAMISAAPIPQKEG